MGPHPPLEDDLGSVAARGKRPQTTAGEIALGVEAEPAGSLDLSDHCNEANAVGEPTVGDDLRRRADLASGQAVERFDPLGRVGDRSSFLKPWKCCVGILVRGTFVSWRT